MIGKDVAASAYEASGKKHYDEGTMSDDEWDWVNDWIGRDAVTVAVQFPKDPQEMLRYITRKITGTLPQL